MTVSDNALSLGMEVPVDKIETELRKLWEMDEARTNASMMNLVLYSEQDGDLNENSEVIREVTREHACRALLIALDRDASDVSVRAWITAHCHLAHGQKSVCCEQIAFHLTGRSTGRFRNTIFAHLQSDLPLIFWWQGSLSSNFSESLYRRIDRLVVDSSSWSDPSAQFAKIAEAIDETQLVVQDLAWTRTYHFRLAVASIYDDLMAEGSLAAVSRLKIEANPDHFVSALQLLAWFAEMAGWKRAEDLVVDDESVGSYRFENQNGNLLDAEILLVEGSAPLGRIEVVSDSVTISVSGEAGAKYLHHQLVCSESKHEIDIHGPADSDVIADLLADQLSRGGKNSLFKRVLPTFMELLG